MHDAIQPALEVVCAEPFVLLIILQLRSLDVCGRGFQLI
jgi:hypothetical protein